MEELDMSRPGAELFPEPAQEAQYNSYPDVNVGHVVDDPLNTGVKSPFDDAGQGQLSDKEMNFRALREETAKLKQESEYWRGQAEAYSKTPLRQPEPETTQEDALSALDWDSGRDVQKAFEAIRQENQLLRQEMKDSIAAIATKSQHQDWNNMVTQHVPQLTSKNPIFAEMIQKASNPYEAAYLLAELNARASQTGQDKNPVQTNSNAQRAIANAQKPQTLASVGGNGTLSNADYYASMSDEDFMKVAARNMANI
jgi:hypothetical protein